MKYLCLGMLLVLLVVQGQAQNKVLFERDFRDGLLKLGNNQVEEATTVFSELYAQDSSNMNLAYLLGQCYARLGKRLPYSIYLLEKAKRAYAVDYRRLDPFEKRVSEYVYYYQLMAYSKYGECTKTLQALNDFYLNYSYENEWYLVDGQRLHRECEQREVEVEEKEFTTINEDYKPEEKRHIIGTKPVQYTDKTAAWGVQVGAFLEPVFTYTFKNLRNIEVYVDQNGVYRYVIGRFVFQSQAEKLLELIQEEGYTDAFVTNVKDMKRFSEEVITIDNESIHKQLVGKVDFRVQIGAFRGDTIPDDVMDVYLRLDSISEYQVGQLTILTVGSFDTYTEAEFYKELVQDLGVKDAFVTSWNYNRRVELKQAKIYLEEQRTKLEERERLEQEEQPEDSKKKKRK